MTDEHEPQTFEQSIGVDVPMNPAVDPKPDRVWDSGSLTLAGIIYGIAVTVVGVELAPLGPFARWAYPLLTLAGLVLGLYFDQRVIRFMRRILRYGRSS